MPGFVEGGRGAVYPEDGFRPCLRWGAPSGPLGEALFWGKHVTLYITRLLLNRTIAKKYRQNDILKVSRSYLFAVLLIFIKDRSSRWAAKYRQ